MVWERGNTIVNNIVFPKRIVSNQNEAMDRIFCLFPDQYPYLIEESKYNWTFSLMWPEDPNFFIDPKLENTLKKLFKLSIKEMSSFYLLEKIGKVDFSLSMLHSRAIILASVAQERLNFKEFKYIVHIDDHSDLMPTLFCSSNSKNVLNETFFKSKIDFSNIQEVIKAVDSGLINIGNFLTTYLLSRNAPEVIYVNSSFKNNSSAINLLEFKKRKIKFANRNYTVTKLESHGKKDLNCVKIQELHSIPENLNVKKNDSIWLDLDLDYFCNRYNGDSDNKNKKNNRNEKSELIRKIDEFLSNLRDSNWKKNIEAVSIAISPAFFPSEYWKYSIDKLSKGIKRILLNE